MDAVATSSAAAAGAASHVSAAADAALPGRIRKRRYSTARIQPVRFYALYPRKLELSLQKSQKFGMHRESRLLSTGSEPVFPRE